MEYQPHWAEHLQTGDRVRATLRHKTDGSHNMHNVDCIVISVDEFEKEIEASTPVGIRKIPFCELKQLQP